MLTSAFSACQNLLPRRDRQWFSKCISGTWLGFKSPSLFNPIVGANNNKKRRKNYGTKTDGNKNNQNHRSDSTLPEH